MPTGVSWDPGHTDITNHYLQLGVIGGFALMALFVSIIWCGFSYVGQVLKANETASFANRLFVWSLGASLFAHAATSISVSYFDQSFVFVYVTLAAIATIASNSLRPSAIGATDRATISKAVPRKRTFSKRRPGGARGYGRLPTNCALEAGATLAVVQCVIRKAL